MTKQKAVFNWSGGKDSALALHAAMNDPRYAVEKMLTTINRSTGRISMHGVREELLDEQARHTGLPLQKVWLPEESSMDEYDRIMNEAMAALRADGFSTAIYGDIFLEDLKRYREERLERQQMQAYFPLWKRNTRELIHEFIDLGFKTIVVCVKADLLDSSFAGRTIDRNFISDLPGNVDPCGENGEFHTFVYDGPVFRRPVKFAVGEKVYKEYKNPGAAGGGPPTAGFWFCDLAPV